MPARKSIRSLVLENAMAPNPLKPRDLAREFQIPAASVHRVTTKLRAEGLLPPSVVKRNAGTPYSSASGNDLVVPEPVLATPSQGFWEQKDVLAIANSEVMPELERMQKLSYLARHAPDAVSISAIKALEDLGRAKGQSVGPGKPLTEDERDARLSRLLLALGREASERVFRLTFRAIDEPEPIMEVTEANESEFPQESSEEHPRPPDSASGLG